MRGSYSEQWGGVTSGPDQGPPVAQPHSFLGVRTEVGIAALDAAYAVQGVKTRADIWCHAEDITWQACISDHSVLV